MRFVPVALFALCGPALAVAPVPKERADAEKVVGTWKMTLDSRGNTGTDLELDFYQGGKMVIRQRVGGQMSVYEGAYRVTGNELPYDVAQGGFVKKETLTIKKLTANELILVDPAGLKEEFARVKKQHEPRGDGK